MTAGNASTINDGAAALVVMSETRAKQLGLQAARAHPRLRDRRHGARVGDDGAGRGGEEPARRRSARRLEHFDLIELNEAFASQAVAVTRECGFDPARVNVNGGAVALGHPIGASGARILTTLLYAMKDRGKKTRARVAVPRRRRTRWRWRSSAVDGRTPRSRQTGWP